MTTRAWYQANIEEERRKARERHHRNRDERNVYSKMYHIQNREAICARQRKRNTGWEPENYQRALEEQCGLCAICAKPMKRPMADHDHDTGCARALLCISCNAKLGVLENPAIRGPLEEYIARYRDE